MPRERMDARSGFDTSVVPKDNRASRFAPEYGPLAQSVEQLAFNQLVGSSSLPRPTISINPLQLCDGALFLVT